MNKPQKEDQKASNISVVVKLVLEGSGAADWQWFYVKQMFATDSKGLRSNGCRYFKNIIQMLLSDI